MHVDLVMECEDGGCEKLGRTEPPRPMANLLFNGRVVEVRGGRCGEDPGQNVGFCGVGTFSKCERGRAASAAVPSSPYCTGS